MAVLQQFSIFLFFITLNTCNSTPKYFLYDFQAGDDRLIPINGTGVVPVPFWKTGKPIKVLIHGWNPLIHLDGFGVIKFHLLHIIAREYRRFDPNFNVILIDWTFWATTIFPKYYFAAENTKVAGIAIAKFLKLLKDKGIINQWKQVHVLGYSLGGHVAGVIGHEIQKLTKGQKIGRITGLDPAGPGFSRLDGKWPEDRSKILDFSDADFVDIIHTSMGGGQINDIFLDGELGSSLQAGHADFYPNGGKQQKYQCTLFKERTGACSHMMAVLFYALSLKEAGKQVACPCNNYDKFLKGLCKCEHPKGTGQLLGEKLSPTARGKYFLTIKTKLTKAYFN